MSASEHYGGRHRAPSSQGGGAPHRHHGWPSRLHGILAALHHREPSSARPCDTWVSSGRAVSAHKPTHKPANRRTLRCGTGDFAS
jgi:hypothetical protein